MRSYRVATDIVWNRPSRLVTSDAHTHTQKRTCTGDILRPTFTASHKLHTNEENCDRQYMPIRREHYIQERWGIVFRATQSFRTFCLTNCGYLSSFHDKNWNKKSANFARNYPHYGGKYLLEGLEIFLLDGSPQKKLKFTHFCNKLVIRSWETWYLPKFGVNSFIQVVAGWLKPIFIWFFVKNINFHIKK